MKLNREKLIETINKKWKTKTCPMCGENNWNIDSDMMAMMRVDEEKNVQLGGRMIPLVALTCNECGNTVLVNPLVIDCVDGK